MSSSSQSCQPKSPPSSVSSSCPSCKKSRGTCGCFSQDRKKRPCLPGLHFEACLQFCPEPLRTCIVDEQTGEQIGRLEISNSLDQRLMQFVFQLDQDKQIRVVQLDVEDTCDKIPTTTVDDTGAQCPDATMFRYQASFDATEACSSFQIIVPAPVPSPTLDHHKGGHHMCCACIATRITYQACDELSGLMAGLTMTSSPALVHGTSLPLAWAGNELFPKCTLPLHIRRLQYCFQKCRDSHDRRHHKKRSISCNTSTSSSNTSTNTRANNSSVCSSSSSVKQHESKRRQCCDTRSTSDSASRVIDDCGCSAGHGDDNDEDGNDDEDHDDDNNHDGGSDNDREEDNRRDDNDDEEEEEEQNDDDDNDD